MINLTVTKDDEINVTAKTDYNVNTSNYNDLINLPTLNGLTIKGNMEESDPTVPDWAKASAPGESITAESVNAVSNDDAISLSYLASLFN